MGANSVDEDQTAPTGSTMFVKEAFNISIDWKHRNFCCGWRFKGQFFLSLIMIIYCG